MVKKSDEQIAKGASTRALLIALSAIIVVISLFAGNYLYGQSLEDDNKRSAFGSQFGAAAALFSGLAFVGLIYAILLQSQELRLQREELALTRKEMEETREEIEGQKKALELQSRTMIKQQFEATFFIMFTQISQISTQLKSEEYTLDTIGEDFTRSRDLFYEIHSTVSRMTRGNLDLAKEKLPEIKKYLENKAIYSSKFINYRKLLSHLFKFIEESTVEDKLFYTDLISITFSNSELIYHFLSALFDDETSLKKYFEKYATFRGINEHVVLFKYFKQNYAPSAFGEISNI